MDLNEYQEIARSLDVYPKDYSMIGHSLGLIGECGEVTEKIKKLLRDANWCMDQERRDDIAKELGDCCWYLANICCDTSFDLDMAYEMQCASITHYIRGLMLPQLIFHMNRKASNIVQSLEIWYYKYNSRTVERDRFTEIIQDTTHMIICIEEIGRRCDFTLKSIYTNNIKKLLDRKKRGVLRGSGDNR